MKLMYNPASPYVCKVRVADDIDIGTVSAACAPGYLDFRCPQEGWRDSRSGLAAWCERFAARSSMSETRPQ